MSTGPGGISSRIGANVPTGNDTTRSSNVEAKSTSQFGQVFGGLARAFGNAFGNRNRGVKLKESNDLPVITASEDVAKAVEAVTTAKEAVTKAKQKVTETEKKISVLETKEKEVQGKVAAAEKDVERKEMDYEMLKKSFALYLSKVEKMGKEIEGLKSKLERTPKIFLIPRSGWKKDLAKVEQNLEKENKLFPRDLERAQKIAGKPRLDEAKKNLEDASEELKKVKGDLVEAKNELELAKQEVEVAESSKEAAERELALREYNQLNLEAEQIRSEIKKLSAIRNPSNKISRWKSILDQKLIKINEKIDKLSTKIGSQAALKELDEAREELQQIKNQNI